ncbi:class II lanthipeptide, LchA2/BrtA2 family [Pontibacillus salicampi]|uniref:Class II lanthipeptide, LchA2/BrtA2 family n=1 Tax=Pontibacillus salicampi TaxID=1449801 RepID=A0ABV6LMR8_9BACI
MKKINAIEEVSEQELKDLAGGAGEQPGTHPSITIPISAAMCPTTKCASIVKPCND